VHHILESPCPRMPRAVRGQGTADWHLMLMLMLQDLDIESLERDNDKGIESLSEKISLLKNVSAPGLVHCTGACRQAQQWA
jgi:hypothetical protein